MSALRKFIALFVALMLLLLFAPSCARLEAMRENPRTAVGAGVGTASGALLGGLAFENAGAVIAGGLTGGLAGGIVGRALESKGKDYASTARDYNYRPAEGTLVRIEDVATDPCRVTPNETVHLIAHYTLLAPYRNKETEVKERWEITHRGRVVGNPVLTLRRRAGTWSSALPLGLPVNAEPGMYRASVEIQADGANDQGVTSFTVRQSLATDGYSSANDVYMRSSLLPKEASTKNDSILTRHKKLAGSCPHRHVWISW